ncbi:hypothetical protein PTTG_10547 [Puccinia triticina 1-1 BBBD Race 1]|uniref:Uncharacterized protein n=1 Tax=Puccinia triticina (isolate 1-1 / race 1 (BBBD)) TaxID=630390 RepID=A0A180GYB7_PUCT1|nr:hypothetical protein PTTG_10547 [Puccinia triticina 1-1 BBBD Race 1]
MIVKDKQDTPDEDDQEYEQPENATKVTLTKTSKSDFCCFLKQYQAIQNQSRHNQLKDNLIELQWTLHEKRVRLRRALGDLPVDLSSDSSDDNNED